MNDLFGDTDSVKELFFASKEALAMLEIYYIANTDKSTPTIDRLRRAIERYDEIRLHTNTKDKSQAS